MAFIHWEDGGAIRSNASYLKFYHYLKGSWWLKGLDTLLWVGG